MSCLSSRKCLQARTNFPPSAISTCPAHTSITRPFRHCTTRSISRVPCGWNKRSLRRVPIDGDMSSESSSVEKATRTYDRPRHLCLTESIALTRLQHRQRDETPPGTFSVKFDVLALFPRLRMLAIIKDSTKTHQIQIIVYRPIELSVFLHICKDWTSTTDTDVISFFGHGFSFSDQARQTESRTIEIQHLFLKPGAVISWPVLSGDIAPWRSVQLQQRDLGHVHIEDEAANAVALVGTLKTIFDHASGAVLTSHDMGESGRPRISLDCSPTVLELVIDIVSFDPIYCRSCSLRRR
jgi:hypothetical protein